MPQTPPVIVETVSGAIGAGKPSRRRYRYAMRDGERVRIRIIDADSPNLAADLLDAFRENVRRIKREQRRAAREAKTGPGEGNTEG